MNYLNMRSLPALVLLISAGLLMGCEEDGASADAPALPYTDFFTPQPAQAVFPDSNPFSEEKRELGEFLFWDPILSGRMNVACATCHHPDHAWADGRRLSIGVDGIGLGPERFGEDETPFHSPSILNIAYTGLQQTEPPLGFESGPYFWYHRAETLEAQAIEPIKSALEMRSTDFLEEEIMPEIIERLESIEQYRELFAAAFDGANPITEQHIAMALATYQRTLSSNRTCFDEFLDGDSAALNGEELEGLNKFINGGCADCHSGPMLSDNQIDPSRPIFSDKPAVRTPSLRNVELTAPYMQDGRSPTLADAIEVYEDRDDLGVEMDDGDVDEIAAFLRTLTDRDFPRDIPDYVPSQLPIGGNL